MKVQEKREHRSYKMAEKPYQKALQRGIKERKPLATMLEKVAELYGKGCDIVFFPIQQEVRVIPAKKQLSKTKK